MVENKELQNIENKKEFGLKDASFYEMDEFARKREMRKIEIINKRKREKKRNIIVLSSFLVFVGLLIFSFSSFFDVDSIEVRGNIYFTEEEVINIAHAEPGKNLLYDTDKGSIVNYLESNPYIKSAKVSRGLPSTMIITVTERHQIAGIKYDDEFLIVDEDGILLRKTKTVPKLTVVEGIVIKKIELGEEIEVKDADMLSKTLKILITMEDKDLYFVRLKMDEMYIKAYIYESLICKGTYEQLLENMSKDRLHLVLNKLFGNGIKRGTIRFTNDGYASFVPTI